jgi:AcrR family transcriptional regulator
METAIGRAPGRPSEGAREALVEAAHELFMERDYDEVSTAEILERSGVSRGALYHHFPTKLDLFTSVWEASERRAIERLAEGAPASATPFEVLLFLARGYLRAAETDDEMRQIGLAQSRRVLGWEGWRNRATQLGLGVALAAVSAAIEAGELPPNDAETTATVLVGAMIEAAMLIVVADDPAAARGRCEAVVVDLLEGLRR